jgi:hypothetical protein
MLARATVGVGIWRRQTEEEPSDSETKRPGHHRRFWARCGLHDRRIARPIGIW